MICDDLRVFPQLIQQILCNSNMWCFLDLDTILQGISDYRSELQGGLAAPLSLGIARVGGGLKTCGVLEWWCKRGH